MEKVTISEINTEPEGDHDIDRRPLTEHLETTDVAINYYRLQPGETMAGGLHAHLDQEEVFFIIEGTILFEMKVNPGSESETITVGSGEIVRFGRGEYQQGRNEGEAEAKVVALGAPKNSIEGRVPKTCPSCSESEYLDTILVEDKIKGQCPECDAIHSSGLH